MIVAGAAAAGGLRALGEGVHSPRLVLDAFLLRSLAVAGYAPALEECAVCGSAAFRALRHRPRTARIRVGRSAGPRRGYSVIIAPARPRRAARRIGAMLPLLMVDV